VKRIRDVGTRGWRESRGAKRDEKEEESDRKEKKREREREKRTFLVAVDDDEATPPLLFSALPCLFVSRGILVAQPCTYHLIKRAPQYRALSWYPTVRAVVRRGARGARIERSLGE